MEYKLNKIEPDVIRQVNGKTREGKIHKRQKSANIIIDNKKKQDNGKSNENDADISKFKKIVFVEAEKTEKIEIPAFNNDKNKSGISMGVFLDVRK